MANKDELNLQKQINKALQEQFDKKLALMKQDEIDAAAAQARIEILKEVVATHEKELATQEKAVKTAADQLKLVKEKEDLTAKERADAEAILANAQEARKQAQDKLDATLKDVKQTQKLVKATAGVAAAMNDAFKAGERFSETMLGIDDRAKMLGKSLTKDGKVVRNIGSQMGKVLGTMGESFTMANQLGKAFKGAESGVIKLNDKLNKTADKYGIMSAIDRAREFETFVKHSARDVGIITEDAMRAQEELFESAVQGTVHTREAYHSMNRDIFKASTAFRKSSTETREAMTLVGADLKQTFNVTATESAAVMQELGTTFGKTGDESAKLTADLAMMAQVQGRDVNKTMSDFAQMSNQLAKFGLPSVTKEFARLQAIEEKTGASMGNLVSAMDTFSTFEGALNAASKLNAAFGSTIDGMELMESLAKGGPADALLLLRERLDETGQSFDTMNFFQKRAMAEATGVGVQDLAKLMATPFDELSKAVSESDGTIEGLTNSQEKLAAATNGTLTAAEAQQKLLDEQAKTMKWAGQLMERMEKLIAQNIGAWGAFGLAAAQALGGVMGAIGGMIGRGLLLRKSRTVTHGLFMGQLRTEIATLQARNALESRSGGGLGRAGGRGLGGAGMNLSKYGARGAGAAGTAGAAGGVGALPVLIGAAVVAGAGYAAYSRADESGYLGSEGVTQEGTVGRGGKFAVGQNMISQPTLAQVGDGGAPELAKINGSNYLVGMGGPQTIPLNAGDSVTALNSRSEQSPQEIVMNFTFVDENGAKKTQRVRRVLKQYMNENLNLSYS